MTSATLTLRGRLRTATLLAAVAAGLAVGALGTARADDVPAVAVKYTAHDLATEQGTLALYRRISTAAHLVCDAAGRGDMRRMAEQYTCREQAVAKAVQAVNSPKLAALYAAHRWRT